MSDRLMTIEDLAEYLGKSVKTIYRWRYRGEGPSGFKVGGHARYRRSDVDAWLDKQRDDRQPDEAA